MPTSTDHAGYWERLEREHRLMLSVLQMIERADQPDDDRHYLKGMARQALDIVTPAVAKGDPT